MAESVDIVISIGVLLLCVRWAYRAYLWDKVVNGEKEKGPGIFRHIWEFRKGYKQAKRDLIAEYKNAK